MKLPGEFQPFQSVSIHAKVRGYVDRVLVDRGSVVKQGQLLAELTAPEMQARIEVEGHEPVVIKDTYSGSSYSGGRAPQALYSQISAVVNLLTYNTYLPVRINRIDCETSILPGRRTRIDGASRRSSAYTD